MIVALEIVDFICDCMRLPAELMFAVYYLCVYNSQTQLMLHSGICWNCIILGEADSSWSWKCIIDSEWGWKMTRDYEDNDIA